VSFKCMFEGGERSLCRERREIEMEWLCVKFGGAEEVEYCESGKAR
jgi:hypothetical protein